MFPCKFGVTQVSVLPVHLCVYTFLCSYSHSIVVIVDDDDELMLNVLRCQLTY